MSLRRWFPFFRHLVVLSSSCALLPSHVTAITKWTAGQAGWRAAVDRTLESLETTETAGAPKLFFLFMARDKLPNERVWARFFSRASRGTDYEVLVHCTDETACKQSIQDLHTFRVIPRIPSKWCEDLVSPMNALLVHALSLGRHGQGFGEREALSPHDKFIFVSDTTVPVKKFESVQQQLGNADGANSSFCIRPWWTWAWHNATDVAVKHDQWLVLSRAHVGRALLSKEGPRVMHRHLTPLHWANVEWLARGLWNINRMVLQRIMSSRFAGWIVTAPFPSGCIDEYWHFASVFGYLDRTLGTTGVSIPGLSSGRLTMDENTSRRTQGRCDTYVRFNHDDQFPELTEELEQAADTIWETAKTFKHPGRFERLSQDSLSVLRNSPFLFARKVDSETSFAGDMALHDAFDSFIFSYES